MRFFSILFFLSLAGCGFQLRGTADLPFDTLYVPNPTGGIALDLKRNIRAGTRAKLVDDPKKAQAIMEFTEETRNKEILSLTGTGRVAKEAEEQLLFRDMQSDMVQQIMRRLAAAQKPKPQ